MSFGDFFAHPVTGPILVAFVTSVVGPGVVAYIRTHASSGGLSKDERKSASIARAKENKQLYEDEATEGHINKAVFRVRTAKLFWRFVLAVVLHVAFIFAALATVDPLDMVLGVIGLFFLVVALYFLFRFVYRLFWLAFVS